MAKSPDFLGLWLGLNRPKINIAFLSFSDKIYLRVREIYNRLLYTLQLFNVSLKMFTLPYPKLL